MGSSLLVSTSINRSKRHMLNSEENVSPKRERMDPGRIASSLCQKCTASLEKHNLIQSSPKAARTRRARARYNLFKEVSDYTQKCINEDYLTSESKKIYEKRDSTAQTSSKNKYAVDIGVGSECDNLCPDRNIKILFNNSENFLKHDSEICVSQNNSAVNVEEAKYDDELDSAVNRAKAPYSRVKKTIAKPTSFLSNLMAKIPSYRRGTGEKNILYFRQ